ncbi:MAG: hypothetical protein ACI8V0_001494 [Pseudohongiellaceae bacterium]|jgi:hypothetical protein
MTRSLHSFCTIAGILFLTLSSATSFAQSSNEETIKEEVTLVFDLYLSAIAKRRWDTQLQIIFILHRAMR